MQKNMIRVRFAPSPSGFMHVGNVRAALMNFLFARQKNGSFILRIEDTDPQRIIDPEGSQIIEDLTWLGLTYDEGPHKGGAYAPYFQSQRSSLYGRYLEECKEKNLVYRCFCSSEELEKRRQRQLALKQPPRYDRACLKLSSDQIDAHLATQTPFIWRFKLDYSKTVSFYDLAHKTMQFGLKHFSDAPITRQDGSFTFMFANFVDDKEMKITHVFRGEDHLTNTAVQVAMYEAFDTEVPVYWHLPIMGNAEGKKLSKRDFGFSLTDLRNAGYLPEAIINYLAIIGHSAQEEIMDSARLIEWFDFEHLSTTGQIRYDLAKLRWVNHHWIMNYDTAKLTALCRPFLTAAYPAFETMSEEQLTSLIRYVQQELVTLKDSVEALHFVVERPSVTAELLAAQQLEKYKPFFEAALQEIIQRKPEEAVPALQKRCKEQGISIKDIFGLLRTALIGKTEGPSIKDLLSMLSKEEVQERLKVLVP